MEEREYLALTLGHIGIADCAARMGSCVWYSSGTEGRRIVPRNRQQSATRRMEGVDIYNSWQSSQGNHRRTKVVR